MQTPGQQQRSPSLPRGPVTVVGPDRSRAVAAELEASMSSSRGILKRQREEQVTPDTSEEEDEVQASAPKRSNVFRSPDKTSDQKRRQRRKSSSRKRSSSISQCPEAVAVVAAAASPVVEERSSLTGIFPPSPAEVLGTPVRRLASPQVLGEREIMAERQLQKKRLNRMLNIFPDQAAATMAAEKAALAAAAVAVTKPGFPEKAVLAAASAAAQKPGGFPFTIGEKPEAPLPSGTSPAGGGFAFPLGSKPSGLAVAAVGSTLALPAGDSPRKNDSSVTFKLPAEFGGVKETVSSTGTVSATTTVTVSSTVTLPTPATNTASPAKAPAFNFGAAPATSSTSDGAKKAEAPAFYKKDYGRQQRIMRYEL